MNVLKADIWDYLGAVSALCIPTNGSVNRQGCAVMGRGIALQAKEKFPGVHFTFGKLLARHGNGVYNLGCIDGTQIITFPVKHKWNFDADLELIEKSCRTLRKMTIGKEWWKVILPKVGCGNGHLLWKDVEPVLDKVFGDDERFLIIDNS